MDPTDGSTLTAADASQTAQATGTHRRTYQACIPCRKRKVRCDLGPVDDPHEPPCQRCRRESKECYFSPTRRKRRASSGDDEIRDTDDLGDESAAYNVRRKSARASGSFQGGYSSMQDATRPAHAGSISTGSPHNGYNYGPPGPPQTSSQYSVAQTSTGRVEDGQDQELTNEAAAALFQSPINTPGDALHLLLQASGQSEVMQRQGVADQSAPVNPSQVPAFSSSTIKSPSESRKTSQQPTQGTFAGNIDPAITSSGIERDTSDAIKADLLVWSRLRFVRAGWFSAKEAINYINYYYQFIAPLTPISPPDLRAVHLNPEILSEEPMLTVTLLTIASRYMQLSGPGARTRSYMVHERLWLALQNMITRMFWGQEQYGGGFVGAGPRKKGPRPSEKGGLRTLGTIERHVFSLLLLSDFHPRSMHFPPASEDDDLMAPSVEQLAADNDGIDTPSGGNGTLSGWTEPALRSDRMTWSLIGLSHALAYELGIFGNFTDGLQIVDGRVKRQGGPLKYYKRADRIERLLYIYITQACGRFGFPSLFPDHVYKFQISTILDRNYSSVDSLMVESQSPGDVIQECWVEMAAINKECNTSLFPSKDQTTRFIQTGEYEKRLQKLQPVIQRWQEKFATSRVAKHPKLMLLIDLHYFRLYINGIALQAVLEKWTNKVGADQEENDPQTPGSTISASFASMYSRNQAYIKEVVEASRTILRYVVYDLLPDDYLKHAPVRVYFRIVSAAMFLLKTFALGAKQDEVRSSLDLLDRTIKAFRTSVVDDVHLCLRIADLLEGLTSSIRNKFVRLPPQASSSPQISKSTSQTPRPQYTPLIPTGSGDQYYQGYGALHPLEGIPQSHTNPHDSNITIMPPPGGSYTNFDFTAAGNQQFSQQQQQQQQQDSYPTDNNGATPLPFPSEEDWLTLDLQPLIDTTGFEVDNNTWYGAFGPETHNNLEVLGKLVNEQWQPGDLGF